MKILIIEGPDNCGKDTAIHQLMSKFYKTKIIHSQKPKYSDPVDALNEQYDLFLNQYKDAYFDYMMDSEDILIFSKEGSGFVHNSKNKCVYNPQMTDRKPRKPTLKTKRSASLLEIRGNACDLESSKHFISDKSYPGNIVYFKND